MRNKNSLVFNSEIIIHPRLEHFLTRWGKWECQQLDGIGRVTSPLMLLLRAAEIDFSARSYGFIEPQYDEPAARLSDAINKKLFATDLDYAMALWILYVLPLKLKKELLEKRKVTKPTLYRHAKYAKLWLSQWMQTQSYFNRRHSMNNTREGIF